MVCLASLFPDRPDLLLTVSLKASLLIPPVGERSGCQAQRTGQCNAPKCRRLG